jgi:hypothetical protein
MLQTQRFQRRKVPPKVYRHTHTKEKIMSKTTENTFNGLDQVKLPEVKFNKNGYEIRTDILHMAKDLVAQEYTYKYQGWELSATRDEKTGQIVTSVGMPEFPGLDKVLEAAEKMYGFVNQSNKK